MWFLYGLYRLLGRIPFRLVLYPVMFYYWLSRPIARRASLEYLQRIQAVSGSGAKPGWRQGLRHFVSFADTILDKMLALTGRYRFDRLRFVGREPVLEMIARGQGGIFATAHVGCLEMIQTAAAVHHRALKLNVLVHTTHAERFNRLLQRLDPTSSVRLIQVTEVNPATAVMLADLVERGEFVAIAADRVPTSASKIVMADFLGAEAAFPVGAYVLAALLRCPLYFLACVREGDAHVVYFDRLAERVVLPRGQRGEALTTCAQAFVRRLESVLVRAPYEWFNFFPFWQQHPPPPVAALRD
jgi:predicted LPLAT superfamily acyltransferase